MAIGQTTITRGTSICCHVWLFIIAWAYTPIDHGTFLCFFTALTSAYVNALHRVGVQYIFVINCFVNLLGNSLMEWSYFAWIFKPANRTASPPLPLPSPQHWSQREDIEGSCSAPWLVYLPLDPTVVLCDREIPHFQHECSAWPGHAGSCCSISVCLLLSLGWWGPKFVPPRQLVQVGTGPLLCDECIWMHHWETFPRSAENLTFSYPA